MPLVIIESPNKIKKLQSILGRDYKIMATKGHIIDLPTKKIGVNLKTYQPTYEVMSDKTKILKSLCDEAKKHQIIYLATDLDREGEAIAYHVASRLPKDKTIYRVKYPAITRSVVLDAMAHPGEINQSLYNAQQARRVIDRLVGYQVSPIMWKKGIQGASAGRVQSVALKYIVDRDLEIEKFIPDEYWDINAIMDAGFKTSLWGINDKSKTVKTEKVARGLHDVLMRGAKTLTVTKVEKKTRNRKTSPPFITSSLQQAGNSVFGWPVDKTMTVAQKLFESGLITYHRTDSLAIDPEKISDLRSNIKTKYGSDYLSKSINTFKNKKSSQEAHEAIRPTGESPTSLSNDDQKLFQLICDRYTASQMADAVYEQIKIELINTETKAIINFNVIGSRLISEGFLHVYGTGTTDILLPDVHEGDILSFSDITTIQKFTQPPPRYTDASLVKKMETDGIGRPATYASIIKTLLTRKFVEKDGKVFVSTSLGRLVHTYLDKFFPKLVDPVFTSQMEDILDDIAASRATYHCSMEGFYTPFKEDLKSAATCDIKEIFKTDYRCPQCNGYLLKRPGKAGWWYACEKYPDCKTVALTDDHGEPIKKGSVIQIRSIVEDDTPKEDAPKCPKCGSAMKLRSGKHGDFWGCTKYMKGCRGTLPHGEDIEKREIYPGVTCTSCGKDMIITTGKFGEYLKCIDAKCGGSQQVPIGICPTCKNHVIKRYSKKKKKVFYSCVKWSDDCDFVTNNVGDFEKI